MSQADFTWGTRQEVPISDKPKILLINPPGTQLYARDKFCTSISKADYYWPQIDLLVLSGRLKQDYDITLVDAIVTDKKPDELLASLPLKGYKAVFFLTSSASFNEDFPFIKTFKEKSPETVMIGIGGLLLMKGEQILAEQDFIDAALLDFTSSSVLDYLKGATKVTDMITRDNGEIFRGELSEPETFSYPTPLHELLPVKNYIIPVAGMPKNTVSMTSMGCRYNCVFCIPATIHLKYRDQDNVLDELEAIKRAGFNHILFHDFTFISDREYTLSLCNKIIEKDLGLSWTCQTRVDTVDDGILAVMKKAGCRAIEFGVESGDNTVLKEMSKGVSVNQIRTAFALAHKHSIRTVGFFIIGMPGETRWTMQSTIDLAVDLDCDYAAFSLPMPHPGTRLGESIKSDGWVLSERDLFDDVAKPNSEIPDVDHDLAWQMRAKAYRQFYLRPRYILKRIFGTKSWYEFKLQFRVFTSIINRILRRYK